MPIERNLSANSVWTFDDEVAHHFDDMIARSIPSYNAMRAIVSALVARYLPQQGVLVDLGCATGEALAPFVDRARCIGVDNSEAMIARARARLGERATLYALDLTHDYPRDESHVTLCVLTLQFIAPRVRLDVLKRAHAHTKRLFVLVEKTRPPRLRDRALLDTLYDEHKRAMGYSREEIEAKKRALKGVLVPLSARENERLLKDAGFTRVVRVWQALHFVGWAAFKKEAYGDENP